LWIKIKEHPIAALHSEDKESFDFHVSETYKALSGYHQHIEYFRGWFNNTRSIAKYEVMKVRGTLCKVGTSNSEATHQSNEAHMPMNLMGIMSPEEHLLKLTERSDQWIKRDLSQRRGWQYKTLSRKSTMVNGSIEMDAIDNLAQYPYETLFISAFQRMDQYTATPDRSEDGVMQGHHVKYNNGWKPPIFIPLGGRCPRPKCITWDHQCVHELVVDRKFHRAKWGTRWWKDEVYDKWAGDQSSQHLIELTTTPTEPPRPMTSALSPTFPDIQTPCNVSILRNDEISDQPSIRANKKARTNQKMTYSNLVQSFAGLANDVCLRNQPAAHLLHGFIQQTINLLSDVKTCKIEEGMLSILNSTTTDLNNVFDGVSASLDDPIPEITLPAKHPISPDLLNTPVTRPITQGGQLHNRIKSASENRRKRAQPCGLTKAKSTCSFCLFDSHYISRCPHLQSFGTLVKEKDVHQTLLDLQNPASKNFPTFTIPNNITPDQQCPKDTTHMVIYGRAYFPDRHNKPFISDRADKQFSLVTFLTKGSCGVALSIHTRKFVSLGTVSAWTAKNKKNLKNIILGWGESEESDNVKESELK